ncbi:MAG: hypothetical protein HXX13_18615 [Bacteroidetes bacterium]|nr:hypothetical protein [Bacteroidota bacterium]
MKAFSFKRLSKDDVIAGAILLLLLVPVIYLAFFRAFECDAGDSVMHYYFAHYAFKQPSLLLDHWAKPLFTLLAIPLAGFGFGGMKFFNGMLGLLSGYVAFLVSKKLDLRFPWMAIILVLFSPSYFINLFSGYTEPLFGLMLIFAIYLVMDDKPISSSVVVSFLPFVRSEGLMIIMVFAFYFFIAKNFKPIILLLTGHLVYAFIGMLAGKDFLWVFTEIPYSFGGRYGHGTIQAYSETLLLTMGVPIFILCVCGIILLIAGIFSSKLPPVNAYRKETQVLLLGSFMAYFLFHSLAWGLGLFGSMGLSRIIIVLVPLGGVMALVAISFFYSWLPGRYILIGKSLFALILAYILIFPFLHNPASFNFKKDFRRSPEMNVMHQIAKDINTSFPGRYLYYSNPYLSYALNINHFDASKHLCFTIWKGRHKTLPNSLVIWDSWFSVVEERTDSTSLLSDSTLRLVRRYKDPADPKSPVFLLFSHE